MANKIEKTRIFASTFVPVGSRYHQSEVVYYGENKYITYPIYKKDENVDSGGKSKYTVINKSSEFRPDLISAEFYGTTMFWWKIMESNGIKDIYDFKSGLSIRIPPNVM